MPDLFDTAAARAPAASIAPTPTAAGGFSAPTHGASWPAWLRRLVREQGPQQFGGRDETGRRVLVIHSMLDDGRFETRYLYENGGRL